VGRGSGVGRSVAKWVGPWSQVPSCDWLEAGKKGRSDGVGGAKPRNGSWAAGDVDKGQQGGNVSSLGQSPVCTTAPLHCVGTVGCGLLLTSCAMFLQRHLPTLLLSWYYFEIVPSHVQVRVQPAPSFQDLGGLGARQRIPSCQTGSTLGRYQVSSANYEFARMQQTTTAI
jgi:hypothetical protein